MQLDRLAITLGLVASIAGRSNEASDLESSKFVQDEGHVEMNHVIEPADDKHDTQTSRGPGGYTDDKETWSCITESDITHSDCYTIQSTISNMGGPDGWWWIPSSTGCNSWQHNNCKAIFCPLDTTEDKDGNPIQEDMVVSTPNLAKQMRLLAKICAEDGRRGYMKADNGSWEFWLAEGGWQ